MASSQPEKQRELPANSTTPRACPRSALGGGINRDERLRRKIKTRKDQRKEGGDWGRIREP